MHLELRTQLTQRLLAAHRLDRNPRFELRTILLSRRRHRPLLCQRLRRNLTLLPGLKSGDHYSGSKQRGWKDLAGAKKYHFGRHNEVSPKSRFAAEIKRVWSESRALNRTSRDSPCLITRS